MVSDRSGSRRVEVLAGRTTEFEFEFEFDAGLLLSGVVIDAVDVPVANAAIDVVAMTSAGDYETLANSGPDAADTITSSDGLFDFRELSPGEWRLYALASGYPTWLSERRLLPANATLHMGNITMVVGGAAVVSVAGDRTGVRFQFVDDSGRPRTDGRWPWTPSARPS